jgi:glutamate-5-semialdehyde dehydrogenase
MSVSISHSTLTTLEPGMQIIYGGNCVFTVDERLAQQFQPGDRLFMSENLPKPLVIPKYAIELVETEIQCAQEGFYALAKVSDDQINSFYDYFSTNLLDNAIWAAIQQVNAEDVEKAKSKGRSTTRLVANQRCRENMVAGLIDFKEQQVARVTAIDSRLHDGWSVDLLKSPLGVVGFVFEGRPNVIADATGVLKTGNVGVFRVGQDALQTANAILEKALYPALDKAGISRNVIRILNSPERATAWALFSNTKLNLAVARGSGGAVRLLGSIAQSHGIPVSLHGTGGAWMMTSESTELDRLEPAIVGSLDRKVCNTVNTICILASEFLDQWPVVERALSTAGELLGQAYKVHIEEGSQDRFSKDLFTKIVQVVRADGVHEEAQFEIIERSDLGKEWEWEQTPEVTVVVVNSVDEGIALFNQYSPQFVASLVTQNQLELTAFFNAINAPFVGNGMTRWVDGQYALHSPELGLSNWENGRFLARSAILSGDSVFTTRLKMNQVAPELKR